MLDMISQLGASVEVFYGVRNSSVCDMHITEAARRVVDAGFGVEVLIAEGWTDRALPSDETIAQFAQVGRRASIMTAHASVNVWAPDTLRTEIEIAARMGVSRMVVHPYVLGQSIEGQEHPVQEARDLCSFARDNGVTLVLENLGLTGIRSMRESVDLIGSEPEKTGLGICIDVGHANRSCTNDGVRPEAFLREFRNMIREVHLDDNLGTKDLHLPLGQGTVDWPPVVEAMRDLRDDAFVCMEIAWPQAPIQALVESRGFLISQLELLEGRCSNV